MKIIVTGGSGKAGRACIKDLIAHGHEVLNVDTASPSEWQCPFLRTDLTDFGQTLDALSGGDTADHGVGGIVHLAAIPAPRMQPNSVTFENNAISTYNVFEAARRLEIKNVVWASSETVLGLPFDTPPPYAPLDEEFRGRPESAYSLSKLVGEDMAAQYCRWDPEMKIVGLRFSNIMEPHDYLKYGEFQSDPNRRKWNMWGYIDARDAAQAIRRSLEATFTGAEIFIIANADTVMEQSSAELMAQTFPNVPLRKTLGTHETLLSIDKARRLLGYEPQFSWRDVANHA